MEKKRINIIKCRVNDKELAVIERKVQLAKCRNMSDFLRRMALSGRIIYVEGEALKDIRKLISSISQNINQIALRVNYQNSIYKDDIEEMQEKISTILSTISDIEKTLSGLERKV